MITKEQIQSIVQRSIINCFRCGAKTTICHTILPNGFEIVTSAGVLDPDKFDLEIGRKICLERLVSKLWELEGYAFQIAVEGDNLEL